MLLLGPLLQAKGITDPAQKQVRDLIGGVQSSLCNHKGRTVQAVGEGIPVRWAIIQ